MVRRALVMARNRKRAAVHIVDIDTALASAQEGRPCVVVAPPGDPFWAGPIPRARLARNARGAQQSDDGMGRRRAHGGGGRVRARR